MQPSGHGLYTRLFYQPHLVFFHHLSRLNDFSGKKICVPCEEFRNLLRLVFEVYEEIKAAVFSSPSPSLKALGRTISSQS